MKLLFLYLCVCVCVCVCVCYRLCGPVCWNLVEMLLKPRDIQLQKMKLWSCISVNESEWECWKESDRGWATDRLHKVTRRVLSHPWEYYSHISVDMCIFFPLGQSSEIRLIRIKQRVICFFCINVRIFHWQYGSFGHCVIQVSFEWLKILKLVKHIMIQWLGTDKYAYKMYIVRFLKD